MRVSRRMAITALGMAPFAGSSVFADSNAHRCFRLPAKHDFNVQGIFLNAAYVHPMNRAAASAVAEYAEARFMHPERNWPYENARNAAVSAFAALVNAEPGEVAVVPSTMAGENMVVQALGLASGRGVVTDSWHYGPSLALYGELHKAGTPVTVVAPRDGRISLEDLDAAIRPGTRLVSVSLVSSATGFQHDLAQVCTIAHGRGAVVYADVIQAAGAIPFDVKASGVDIACCGGYKWLQADAGAAFLYVRNELLGELTRPQVGWRQLSAFQSHSMPGDPPGSAAGEWSFEGGIAGLFEVSSPSYAALECLSRSIGYIKEIGVDAIAEHRRPMLERLRSELPRLGFTLLAPNDAAGPFVACWKAGASEGLRAHLVERGIQVSFSRDRIRVAPSLYNDMDDVEAFIREVRRAVS